MRPQEAIALRTPSKHVCLDASGAPFESTLRASTFVKSIGTVLSPNGAEQLGRHYIPDPHRQSLHDKEVWCCHRTARCKSRWSHLCHPCCRLWLLRAATNSSSTNSQKAVQTVKSTQAANSQKGRTNSQHQRVRVVMPTCQAVNHWPNVL